jgi:WD40 repeat protein
MAGPLAYDVFLSHSSKDKEVVRAVAERLQGDGIRVWFDEWEIKPGDSIPAKIEEGLEQSRVLVLAMSANAFASDWSRLESYTFRFRDPLNKERRFVPLRLDDAPIKGSLAQFLYINWLPEEREREYARLLEACRPLERSTEAEVQAAREQFEEKVISLRHAGGLNSVVYSPDGLHALSGSEDHTVRLWELTSGHCLRTLEGHTAGVNSVAWSPDGRQVLSGSDDRTLRLWEVASGRCLRTLEGHKVSVNSVGWSGDGRRAFSTASNGVM